MLVAAAMCLSACGESKDTGSTPLQPAADQPASQAGETYGETDAQTSAAAGDSEEKSDGVRQDSGSGSKTNDNGTSGQSSSGSSGSKESGKQETQSRETRADDPDGKQTEAAQPAEETRSLWEDRDNAEVSFNDL